MVDALRESWRVLKRRGVLIDERPASAPMIIEVMAGMKAFWPTAVNRPVIEDDNGAADRAVRHAVGQRWFMPAESRAFSFDIYCDAASDLMAYAQMHRRMRDADIPYGDLEKRRRELTHSGQMAYLRCRRPWAVRAFHKA